MTAPVAESMEYTSSQLSWLRTELSDVRTLLSWVRTSVSMIGFVHDLQLTAGSRTMGSSRMDDAARNLGLSLVGSDVTGHGDRALELLESRSTWTQWPVISRFPPAAAALDHFVPAAAVILVIGLITFIFMLRTI
ncbi:MAG: hypothetical protein R2853_19240 [Thermomicrobiales bacterium]